MAEIKKAPDSNRSAAKGLKNWLFILIFQMVKNPSQPQKLAR
tara:strand:+ start:600 stop:725 length:126 start_codon:yes stop_codon:yes gene_type:complete